MLDHDATAIKAMYDERSESYDNSIHASLAQQHIENAQLKPGQSVLDLACGTGLVTLLAKQQVGQGKVVGVDFSEGMLDVAHKKTQQQNLEIEYYQHDISNLDELQLLSKVERGFDVIFCVAALVLLKDPQRVVKHWASLLAPNGKLLVDANPEGSMLAASILKEIGSEIGQSLIWDDSSVNSESSLQRLFENIGLVVERVYTSGVYETRTFMVGEGPEIFEKTVASPMFRNFGDAATREKAKALFVKKLQARADGDGFVYEDVRFYFGVARKRLVE
ncbi:hypothetical protein ACLMJK_009671 [Lecanora helva]